MEKKIYKFCVDTSDKRNQFIFEELRNKKINVIAFSELNKNDKCDTYIFSPAKRFGVADVEKFPNNCTIIAGGIPLEIKQRLDEKAIRCINLLSNQKFAIKNANLTAEGILALILEHSQKSIFFNNCLILGGGRISKSLAVLFEKLGVKFSVASFDEEKYLSFLHYNCPCFLKNQFEFYLSEFDILINTRPIKYFDINMQKKIQNNAIFFETASINCMDKSENLKFNYILAPSLPQKYSAETAGKIMLECLLGELDNGEKS